MKPLLLVLSAPSGGGKTTIARSLLAARTDVRYSVSATTRPPRAGEQDGVDYHFLPAPEFDRLVAAGEFLEWAEYGTRKYGTLKREVDRILAEGHHAILDIEVQGARAVRERCQNVVSVFILPPSAEALVQRLGGRATERRDDLRRRLERAVDELEEAPSYDYVVVNADRAQAVAEVAAILDTEGRRPARMDDLEQRLEQLSAGIRAELAAFDRKRD